MDVDQVVNTADANVSVLPAVPNHMIATKIDERDGERITKEDKSIFAVVAPPNRGKPYMHELLYQMVLQDKGEGSISVTSSITSYLALMYKTTIAHGDHLGRLQSKRLSINRKNLEVTFNKFGSEKQRGPTTYVVQVSLFDLATEVQGSINGALYAACLQIPEYSIRKNKSEHVSFLTYHVAFEVNPKLDRKSISMGAPEGRGTC